MNPKLCIGKSTFLWKDWLAKGILKLGDVYENSILKSFNQLTQTFELNKTQFWRYLQLRHLLCGTFDSSSQGPPEDNILSIILEAWGRGHEASVYYRWIMEKVGYSFHSAT